MDRHGPDHCGSADKCRLLSTQSLRDPRVWDELLRQMNVENYSGWQPAITGTVVGMLSPGRGTVFAVSCDRSHRFSKPHAFSVRLIEGHGIEGDAHAGAFIKHRYLARQDAQIPNNRQVHLIQSELFKELRAVGFDVGPGQLGENITTKGIDLLTLPLGARLRLGPAAVVELTGLRTPCGYIDKFQKGLKRAMIVRTPAGVTFRAGVLGVVRASGDVSPGDSIQAEAWPAHTPRLPAI